MSQPPAPKASSENSLGCGGAPKVPKSLGRQTERRARLAELEGDRAELLAAYSGKAAAGLDLFSPEERHRTYKKLRLVVLVRPNPDDPRGDLEVTGVLK